MNLFLNLIVQLVFYMNLIDYINFYFFAFLNLIDYINYLIEYLN